MQYYAKTVFYGVRALKNETTKRQNKNTDKMKSFKISSLAAYAAIALCGLMTCFATSCDSDDDNQGSLLRLSAAKVELTVGKSAAVTVGSGTAPYTVLSSDKTTATATANKNTVTITGVKAGTAYILVTSADKATGRIAVVVKGEELSLEKSAVSLAVGKEMTVGIKSGTAPYTATVKDASIATATVGTKAVTIKALKAGTTTVTLTDSKKVTGTITVMVK